MVEQDYIMRIIHEMVRTLLKLLFHIDDVKEQEMEFEDEGTQDTYKRLQKLADSGGINDAENLLYEVLESKELEHLKLALVFYDYLNTKSSDYLEECGYSREEIAEGMKQAVKLYGYDGLADTLLETPES